MAFPEAMNRLQASLERLEAGNLSTLDRGLVERALDAAEELDREHAEARSRIRYLERLLEKHAPAGQDYGAALARRLAR